MFPPLLARHLILCKLIAHHMGCDTRLVSIRIIACVSSPGESAANLLCTHLPNDSCLHTASLEGSLSQCDFLHFNKTLARRQRETHTAIFFQTSRCTDTTTHLTHRRVKIHYCTMTADLHENISHNPWSPHTCVPDAFLLLILISKLWHPVSIAFSSFFLFIIL